MGQMAVKLDINKAYDRVEWAFLRKVMLKLGLNEKWVQLAMETVCIATYSVLINGEPKGFVTPTRGIKQGDLLSPYLFLFYAKGLSAMIRKAEEARNLQGVLFGNRGGWFAYPTFCLQMIVSFFAKLQWRNANDYQLSQSNIRQLQGKL